MSERDRPPRWINEPLIPEVVGYSPLTKSQIELASRMKKEARAAKSQANEAP